MPLRPGISMSSRHTSAPEAPAASTTSSPRPTCATTSRSGSRPSSAASAPRTSAWSSASSTLIAQRHLHPVPGPAGPTSRVPPTPVTRSRMPRRPLPSVPAQPAPSSVTAMPAGSSSMRKAALRVAYDVGDRLAQRPGEHARWRGSVSATGRRRRGRSRPSAAPGAGGEPASSLPARSPPTVARISASDCRAVDWIPPARLGPGGVDVDQPLGELGLDGTRSGSGRARRGRRGRRVRARRRWRARGARRSRRTHAHRRAAASPRRS